MRIARCWSTLSALFAAVSAQTISGLSFDSRDVVSLVWGVDGALTAPYDFYLCAGDESTGSYDSLARVIEKGNYASGDKVSFRVNQEIGGNDPDAYFLKIVPLGSDDEPSGFTSHFTLTNMKGSFSTEVSNAVKSMQPIPISLASIPDSHLLEPADLAAVYNGSAPSVEVQGPATESFLQFPTPSSGTGLNRNELRKRLGVDAHAIPYGEQTGLTKYAPTPKRAGTTIATKSATPQYPPFPFSIATTYLPPPTVQYTDTAYATFTTHSIENTAAPAAAPTLDKRMQAWLERWRD
ncbi:hypothetical protein N7492_002129 [Penicillium capsulatum]|uniref:Yeast cell wall synthesis Kre9/Knh1 C-terminal domain-containing protein n=1 Tax=Penicillium capsulatum TaxID=69766 RepID=A0A9W9IH95_9EURO|nr:hypothetical protein N7492_002129 [Penicillium capsulatum]KAJ6123259.1 hypothetical protein N7512_005724 [Penicillium capsulatum]